MASTLPSSSSCDDGHPSCELTISLSACCTIRRCLLSRSLLRARASLRSTPLPPTGNGFLLDPLPNPLHQERAARPSIGRRRAVRMEKTTKELLHMNPHKNTSAAKRV
uniref:Uncharacterized protein n=1 Tax=Leersia perrieri TaxID=77586 RepID=A0A0D9X7A1_9ORYZ